MSIENNKAVAREMIDEVFNQGNMNLADELLSPNYIEHDELPPGVPAEREGLKQIILMTRAAFPDFAATIEKLVAEGDKVAQRITWTGTHKGDFMGIPATGKPVSSMHPPAVKQTYPRLVNPYSLPQQQTRVCSLTS